MGTDIKRPQLSFTLFCDDVRQEVGGKMSFIGVFENIYANTFPAMHLRLTIINEWMGDNSDHDMSIRIYTPDRNSLIAQTKSRLSLSGRMKRCRHISMIINLEFKTQGTYWVDIVLDRQVVSSLPLPVMQIGNQSFH